MHDAIIILACVDNDNLSIQIDSNVHTEKL